MSTLATKDSPEDDIWVCTKCNKEFIGEPARSIPPPWNSSDGLYAYHCDDCADSDYKEEEKE